VYFIAETVENLKPILCSVHSSAWHVEAGWANGSDTIYFMLQGPAGPADMPGGANDFTSWLAGSRMIDDDNIKKLPVRFRKPLPEDRTLVRPFEVQHKGGECSHLFVQYIVDETLAEVECGKCHAKLNPIWVLGRLAREDRRYKDAAARYQEEMKRLSARSRTKCMNCGQMTRISHS
jgi:hypothetical protein